MSDATLLALAQGWGSPEVGRWVFAGVFALLTLWLLFLPGRLIGQPHGPPPWYRNVRVWALFVAVAQMLVYLFLAQLSR